MNSPWTMITTTLRQLSARVDAMPTIREATLTSQTTVRFDIDAVDTTVHGSLVAGATPGTRVLTLTLKHYVWILGAKGGVPVPTVPAIASTAEAQAGTDNTKMMTPAATRINVTARLATLAQAEAGADTFALMTPQRVAQAIAKLTPKQRVGRYATGGVTLSPNTGQEFTISYGTTFASIPEVFANSSTSGIMVSVTSRTTSGCTIRAYNPHNAGLTTGSINWLAITNP